MGQNPNVGRSPLPQYSAGEAPTPTLYKGGSLQLPASGLRNLGAGMGHLAGVLAQGIQDDNETAYRQQELDQQEQDRYSAAEAAAAASAYQVVANDHAAKYDQEFPSDGDLSQYVPGFKSGLKSKYDSIVDGLHTDLAKQLFQAHSYPATAGAFETAQTQHANKLNSRTVANTEATYTNAVASLINDPKLMTSPDVSYAKAVATMALSLQGMDEEHARPILTQYRQQLSASLFTVLGNKDPEAALTLLHHGHVFDLPGEKQAGLMGTLQGALETQKRKEAADMYGILKDSSEGVAADIMQGRMSFAQAKQGAVSLGLLLNNKYSTLEQKQWAIHQVHTMEMASMVAKAMPPGSPYNVRIFQQLKDMYDENKPGTFIGRTDPVAAKTVLSQLNSLESYYTKHVNLGVGLDGHRLDRGERVAAGIGAKLTPQELDEYSNQLGQVVGAEGDKATNMIKWYDQFAQEMHGDPHMVVAALQQMYGNQALYMNKQRVLALQASVGRPLEVRRQLVTVAGLKLSDLTDKWDPKAKDAGGELYDPAKFNQRVANNPTLANIRNNPLLGVMQDQYNDTEEMITKLAASNVNRNMSQAKAIEQAVRVLLPGKQVGNYLVNEQYNPEQVKSGLNLMRERATSAEDPTNAIRSQLNQSFESNASIQAVMRSSIAPPVSRGFSRVVPGGVSPKMITSGVGQRPSPSGIGSTNHQGVDVAVPIGTPILVPTDARVKFAGPDGGHGNSVVVELGDGSTVRFSHLSQIVAQEGAPVGSGDTIGLSGSTGRSTGPHVHVEWRDAGGKVKDPRSWLINPKGMTDPGSNFHFLAQLNELHQSSGASSLRQPNLQIFQLGVGAALGPSTAQKLMTTHRSILDGASDQPLAARGVQNALHEYKALVEKQISRLPASQQAAATKSLNQYFQVATSPGALRGTPYDPQQRNQSERALKTFKAYGDFILDPAAPGQSVLAVYPDENGVWRPLVNYRTKQPVSIPLKDAQQYRPTPTVFTSPERVTGNQLSPWTRK